MVAQPTCRPAATQSDTTPVPPHASCRAKQLLPRQRRELAIEVLAGTHPVSDLATRHQVGRKFLYHQADTARLALGHAFDPIRPADEILFHLPVTKAWLRQLIPAPVLIGRGSYRGAIAPLADLFDTKLSPGTVHNAVHAAVASARQIDRSYDLAGVRVGLHDEIFQAGRPVLVGVDAAFPFCYLSSQEEHLDAETRGVRLLELVPPPR